MVKRPSPESRMEDLYEEYREDPHFNHLRRDNIRLVPGFGSYRPKLFIVGEAPGARENLEGRPFVGASGASLRSLMADCAGIPDGIWYMTNVVKYRPPGNRTPSIREILDSQPYLRREWQILGGPTVMVAVGATAFTAIGPAVGGITAFAGQVMLRGHGQPYHYLWPMLHPAYGLRHQKAQPTMERHWENLGDWLREEGLM